MRSFTTAGLIETFRAASGLPLHQVLQLGRYLRLAAFLPPSGRERSLPQIASVHAAATIVGGLMAATTPALRIAEELPRIYAMRATFGPTDRYFDFITDPGDLPKIRNGQTPPTLGQVIELTLIAVHHPQPAQRAAFADAEPHLSLQPEAGVATLTVAGRTEMFTLSPGSPSITSSGRIDDGGIWTTRSVSTSVIRALGDLIEANRVEAADRAWVIPTAIAYRALNARPPNLARNK